MISSCISYLTLFVFILLFSKMVLPTEMSEASLDLFDVCQNCSYGCDKETGICSGACRHGFYGETCEQTCASCYDCKQTSGECTTCRNRHYGKSCEFECNENCMIGCYIDGRCYNCNEGYWGKFCNNTCPSPHCRNGCERWTGNCTSWGCYGGYWGNNCTQICPKHCGYGYCKQPHGTCQTCAPGYSGSKCTKRCNYEHCSLCQFDVTTCYNCFHGWYGDHCDKTCPGNCKEPYCNQRTGKCQTCVDGFYGPYCNGVCLDVCETCSDKSTCDSCKVGFYGKNCDLPCHSKCKECNRNGKCKVCETGLFGGDCKCKVSECAKNDSNECISCKNNFTWYPSGMGCCPCSEHCKGYDGLVCNASGCINGCYSEYFGDHCSFGCSENCAEVNGTTCNNVTGLCDHGCEPGWFLSKCDFNCTLNYPHCMKCIQYQKDIYSKELLVACNICEKGYYKDFLSSFCRPCENCVDDECDGYNGGCKKGCISGWYARRKGYLCENRCPDNCANNSCDLIGGACIDGCKQGYYGKYCEQTCPGDCMHGLCNNETGDCIQGCTVGKYGFQCNETCNEYCKGGCVKDGGSCKGCLNGFYGLDCHLSCNTTCKSGTCEFSNGYCLEGCIDGWGGVLCEVEIPLSRTTGSSNKLLQGFTIGLSVILFMTIVWVIKLKFYRRRDDSDANVNTDSNMGNISYIDATSL